MRYFNFSKATFFLARNIFTVFVESEMHLVRPSCKIGTHPGFRCTEVDDRRYILEKQVSGVRTSVGHFENWIAGSYLVMEINGYQFFFLCSVILFRWIPVGRFSFAIFLRISLFQN
jgi:hypothetical protein